MSRGVPVELTTFVGRRTELAEGRRMLRAARAVTLVGPGGVGKTRLAQRLARQVERSFRDGVVWVELAAQHDPASVAGQVASALDLEPQGQTALDAVATYLTSRQLLLVLDNCEHLLEASADLVRRLVLHAPELRVLATSRQPLSVEGEHVISIGPLTVPTVEESARGALGHVDAVTLLADRVRAFDPGFRVDSANAELVGSLCRALEGIPLAIELAAPRLRVLSLAQLNERLVDGLGVLASGPRSGPERHQTLRALLDWSHDLCSPGEQALWARMSVFEGGADLAAVEAVCGEAGSSTSEALAGLTDKSVVTVVETEGRLRCRMLETIRAYGAERLAVDGECDAVRERHRDHFLAVAVESRKTWFGPGQLELIGRTRADLGNLRAAFDHSLETPGRSEAALVLASSLAWYWAPVGALDEGARWLAHALASHDVPSSALLQALADAAHLCGLRNDVEGCRPIVERAVALPLIETTAADRAARHLARAHLATITGAHEEAVTEHHRALPELRASGDLVKLVDSLAFIAIINGFLGRPADGFPYLSQAEAVCDEHGERFERQNLFVYEASLHRQQGRHELALEALRASLTAWPLLRPVAVASDVESMAMTYALTGETRTAAVMLGARVRIWDDFGYPPAPYLVDGFAPVEKQLTEALGETPFRSAYDEGYQMSLEQVVSFALGQGSAPVRPPTAGAVQLSRRELQVARLLANGLSNKEIAEQLVISPRTAEGHVAKVLDKLGVQSREQVAAWLTADPEAQE